MNTSPIICIALSITDSKQNISMSRQYVASFTECHKFYAGLEGKRKEFNKQSIMTSAHPSDLSLNKTDHLVFVVTSHINTL